MKQSGVPYERIAFVSFGKGAIGSAKSRLNLSKEQGRYFRTLHSMNFFLLGIKKSQMAHNHLHTFNAKFSKAFLEYETRKTLEDTVTSYSTDTIDDDFYKQMMIDRQQLLPFDYVPPRYAREPGLYINFKRRYLQWLTDNDLIDFIGLIERGIEEQKIPPVDLFCVDEWQDLNPLQVKQIAHWSQNIPRSAHAGDDDQTIHEWAGARSVDFIEFPRFKAGEKEVIILNKTHRLPAQVLDMSVSFIRKNKNRVDKEITSACDERGLIEYTNIDKVSDHIKQALKNGTCKVLVRNNALKRYVIQDLVKRGIPVTGKLSTVVKALAVIDRSHTYITVEDMYEIAKSSIFPAKGLFEHGGKKGLAGLADALAQSGETKMLTRDLLQFKVLDTLIVALENNDYTVLRHPDLEYAISVYKQFGGNYQPVEVTSIHQAKGSEADTVVVCLDVTKRTYLESRNPARIEEERRVWYVAMTRSKKNLIFLRHTYQYFYPSPMEEYVKHYLSNRNEI